MKVLFAVIAACLLTPLFIPKANAQTNTTYWWNDDVFYEAFVRSYYDTNNDGVGDFNGLTAKLDYIKSLGADAIWLMPVCPSPSYHGYDVINYKALNSDYGTKQDYINFVTAAHAKGMKVIFDAVMNHTSNENPWFIQSAANNSTYRDYYRWSSTNPGYNGWNKYSQNNYYYGIFCNCMPDINYYNTAVKDSMFTVIDFWLDSMHVDGFRCDAAPYIFESNQYEVNCPETLSFWQDFRNRYKTDNPNAMAVGEVWMSDDTILEYSTNNRFDFCFEFNLASDILGAVNGSNMQNLISNFQWRYTNFPFAQYGTFISNHDQNRSFDALGDNVTKAKLAAAIYLTLPGIPFVYYGEEVGMVGSGADQNKRTPMQWTNGSNAGFSTHSPWESINSNYATYNVETEMPDSNSLLTWYKKLIRIRHANQALTRGTYLNAKNSNNSVWSYVRSYNGQDLLVVINTSSSAYTNQTINLTGAGIPDGEKLLSDLIAGNSMVATLTNQQLTGVSIPANSAAVYTIGATNSITTVSPNSNIIVFPNPVTSTINFALNNVPEAGITLTISDVEGKLIKTEQLSTQDISRPQDVSSLPAGVYLVHLFNDNINYVARIVKM